MSITAERQTPNFSRSLKPREPCTQKHSSQYFTTTCPMNTYLQVAAGQGKIRVLLAKSNLSYSPPLAQKSNWINLSSLSSHSRFRRQMKVSLDSWRIRVMGRAKVLPRKKNPRCKRVISMMMQLSTMMVACCPNPSLVATDST